MRPPSKDETDRALAFYRFLQHEEEGTRKPGTLVAIVEGDCEVVAVIERPRRFTRATKILHDRSPLLTCASPSSFIVRVMLKTVRSLERFGGERFDVRELSTREGDTPLSWVRRCRKAVIAWQLRTGVGHAVS